jgi:hypothetical protein
VERERLMSFSYLFTPACNEAIAETGADFDADVERVRAGLGVLELLQECLAGADDDRVEGWEDYVYAVAQVAKWGRPASQKVSA